MSPMPPAAASPEPQAYPSSGASATIASVVISRPATDAASCSAVRTTLVGSMMPTATSRNTFRLSVEAERVLLLLQELADHDRAFDTGVLDNLAHRRLQGPAHDVDARGLVVVVAGQLRRELADA